MDRLFLGNVVIYDETEIVIDVGKGIWREVLIAAEAGAIWIRDVRNDAGGEGADSGGIDDVEPSLILELLPGGGIVDRNQGAVAVDKVGEVAGFFRSAVGTVPMPVFVLACLAKSSEKWKKVLSLPL